MCRLLFVRSGEEFRIEDHLRPFAEICRGSREYQGHGWGCAWLVEGEWRFHHDIRPVWDDDLARFGETTRLVAHARSAFEDRDIRVENNMPFHDERHVFVFNGELRGVRIREEGRIGAEKVFRFIKRFDRGDTLAAVRKAVPIIHERSAHVRAMNLFLVDRESACVATSFREDAEYFTLRRRETGGELVICSEPYPGEESWEEIPGGTIEVYR